MRIAIDARLNAYRRGGIPQYTRQLVTALAALERNEQFILLQHRQHLRPLVVAPNVQRRTLFTPPHHRLEQWSLPLELLAIRPDVLHSPDFVVPSHRPCAAVVTVHDLAFMHYPEILDDAARQYYSQVRESVHSAEAVIAVSNSTRDDIVSLLELPPERIDVVYEAASPGFTSLELAPGATHTIGMHTLRAGTFGLFVSTLEPRKNLPTLLKALRVCVDRRPETIYRLVVAGARGWRYKPIFETVRDLHLEDVVLFLDSVSDDDLRWLYSGCVYYANPSLYEGFALPPLEALACGAATLVSATSSLPEVVGDAALLLPPLDVEAWADAIELIWHDHTRRTDLAARGPAQARKFSWQRAARQTMTIYQQAVARRGTVSEGQPARVRPSVVAPVQSVSRLAPPPVPEPPAWPGEISQPQVSSPQRDIAGTQVVTLPETPAASGNSHASVNAVGQRNCLRCGAVLEAGLLIGDVGWRSDGAAQPAQPRHLRAWACDVCGKVELELINPVVATHNGSEIEEASVTELSPAHAVVDEQVASPTNEAVVCTADASVVEPDALEASVSDNAPSDDMPPSNQTHESQNG